MKRIILLFLPVCLALVFLAVPMQSRSHTVLRVGVFPLDPLSFQDENGATQGLYPDVIREIFKGRSVDIVFVNGSWAQGLSRLQNEEIDLMTSIAYSAERAQSMDFCKESVLDIWSQAFARPKDNVSSIRDLEDQNVAIMAQDINGKNFIATANNLGIACTTVEFPTHADVFKAVERGDVKAGIAPQHYGLRNSRRYNLVPTSIIFSPFPVYFAAKKGRHPDVLLEIDRRLSEWKKDKNSYYYHSISFWMGDKHLQRKIIPSWLIWLMAVVLSIAGLLLFINWWLNRMVRARTRELRAKEREYRELVEGANTVIIRWDRDGRILFMNSFGFKLFGYTREEIIGQPIMETIVPDQSTDGVDLSSLIREIIDAPEQFKLKENENICKDGSRVYIQWSNRPMFDENGQFLEMLSIGTDISERKRLEADLFQARKMEAIGTLAGGIAHDFNNILSIIMGYAEIAQIYADHGSELDDSLIQVVNATKRARDLVKQILAFSRKTVSSKQVFLLSDLVREALGMIRSTFPATIRIEQNIGEAFRVYGNPGQIQQVVINLCTNALHAMEPAGGVLGIALGRVTHDDAVAAVMDDILPRGDYVCIEVRDTGIGIPREVIKSIFDPYFTTKKQGKGTGLGLAVVHGIVKDHKGHITVDSSPGQGSVFKVFLPMEEEYYPMIEPVNEEKTVAGGHETLILVDDEQSIVEATRRILQNQGYTVMGFTKADEALAEFKRRPNQFDLLITDMTMSGMTGSELAQAVLRIRPGFPIILCTGYSESMDREKADRIGIAQYIGKPVVSRDLLRIVREVLDTASSLP